MKKVLSAMLCASLASCATVGGYLNGQYNSEAFPPLDSPPDKVALVTRSTMKDPENVLVNVDDLPIAVNPQGSGNGLWAKQVALLPGDHIVTTGWRHPGMYAPEAWECHFSFVAGHQYSIEYEVMGKKARVWINDPQDPDARTGCAAQTKSQPHVGWPL